MSTGIPPRLAGKKVLVLQNNVVVPRPKCKDKNDRERVLKEIGEKSTMDLGAAINQGKITLADAKKMFPASVLFDHSTRNPQTNSLRRNDVRLVEKKTQTYWGLTNTRFPQWVPIIGRDSQSDYLVVQKRVVTMLCAVSSSGTQVINVLNTKTTTTKRRT